MSSENVAKRVYVTLPETVSEDLQRWADIRDQATATVAAIAIEMYLGQLKQSGELPSTAPFSAKGTKNEQP